MYSRNIDTAVFQAPQQESKPYTSTIKSPEDSNESNAFVAKLKVYSKEKDLQRGKIVHADIIKRGLLDKEVFVGNSLVNMYAKCGALEKAQELFNDLPVRTIVSWNALIGGYAEHQRGKEAISCFEHMQLRGVCPNAVTFLCVLKACGSIGDSGKGQQVHAQIVNDQLLDSNIYVGSALVDMYAKCGELEKAQEVFDKLPARNEVSWNGLIAGFAQHGHGEEALLCFEQMELAGFSPNSVTYVCVLKACGNAGASSKGQELHAQIVKEGLLKKNILVANALVDMHAKCGALERAQEVFHQIPTPNIVSWNALIGGYSQHGHGEKALSCFEQMQQAGISPNAITFVCALKACGKIRDAKMGQAIHTQILRDELLETNMVVANALIDMYAKCGSLDKAQEVFDGIQQRDVFLWNALITGHAQHDHGEETLDGFEQMQLDGFSPDGVTFAYALKACGSMGAACKGQEMHTEIVKDGLLEGGMVVATALVDLYAKCGMLAEAEELFDELAVRDVVSWNVLMAGYAHLGKDDIVSVLLDRMIEEGIQPDLVTCTLLLTSCSHRGQADKGERCFEVLSRDYGISPSLEQHTCMVDLFGRAGHLESAVAVIEEMESAVDYRLLQTLLDACGKCRNLELGGWVFQHGVQLDDDDPAAYVSMRNSYAAAGWQAEADAV